MDFRLITPALASNCWPATPQELINEAFDKTRGELQDLTGVIISASQPAVDDQDKEWIRIDGAGRENGRFVFGSGSWNRLNEEPASPNNLARRIFVGTEPQSWSYDGGDGTNPSITTPTPTTGAMWEVDHAMDNLIPMGVGTVAIPGSSPPVSLTVATAAGAAGVTQTAQQLAPHSHALSSAANITSGGNILTEQSGGGSSPGLQIGLTGNADQPLTVLTNTYATTQQPMNIIPPVYGVYFLKRTNRTHYVA